MRKVLFVDDDEDLLLLNKKYFTKHGYQVMTVKDGSTCLNIIKRQKPDCIVLDVMLPNMNGYVTCKEIRKKYDIPVIFLSGRVEESDRIKGLLLGGDDYVIKPYSLQELEARVKVNINRYYVNIKQENKLQLPPLLIDIVEHKVYYNEKEIVLNNREYQILLYMAEHPNKEITFQELGEMIWGVYQEEDRKTIMVNMSRLRKKIDGYEGLDNLIETVWSKGYKLVYREKRGL